MASVTRQRLRLSGGTELSYLTAGDPSRPAVLLLHGFPNSADGFRDVIPVLSEAAYVVAPDLPGYGQSDPLAAPSFDAHGAAIAELVDHLGLGPRYVYLHDWGAPVGFHIAMAAPELVLGLIIQNGNAHHSGLGPAWADTKELWKNPTPEIEAKTTSFLTFEGTRDQYLLNVPSDVTAAIPAARWEEDWRVMGLPGRMDTHRALVADYGRYVERFDELAAWLAEWQPPAVLVWGRHDFAFDVAEVFSWLEDLPRLEAHVFDGGHLLLETHAGPAAAVMLDFIRRTQGTSTQRSAA